MASDYATTMAEFAAAVAAFNRAAQAAAEKQISVVVTLFEARDGQYGAAFPQLFIERLEQTFE